MNEKEIVLYLEKNLKFECNNYAKLFDNLKKRYRPLEMSVCYRYILEKQSDIGLLKYTIKQVNSTKYPQNLNDLINFILLSQNQAPYLDLKVLAIKTISGYKNKKALPALLSCLNDKSSNYKIRLAAAEALGKIGDKNAFEALGKVAVDIEEKSSYVKESAVMALGLLGDSRAIDVFDSILETKQIFLDKFVYLKERIMESMAKLDISKNQKALSILKTSLLDSNPKIRISAIETVMNSSLKESKELIYDRLRFDDDLEVKKNALIALYNITDRSILDEIIENDFDAELKNYAKEIIDEYEN